MCFDGVRLNSSRGYGNEIEEEIIGRKYIQSTIEKMLVNTCTYVTLYDILYIFYRILSAIIFYCIALWGTDRRQPWLFNCMFAVLCSWTTSLQTSKRNTRFRAPDNSRLLWVPPYLSQPPLRPSLQLCRRQSPGRLVRRRLRERLLQGPRRH